MAVGGGDQELFRSLRFVRGLQTKSLSERFGRIFSLKNDYLSLVRVSILSVFSVGGHDHNAL